MLLVYSYILVTVGLSLCLLAVLDAFFSSWRRGVLVLVFLPVAAPIYAFRSYSGNRSALGLGIVLTLGLGAIAFLAVYFTAMQSTSSFRQVAAEHGYALRLGRLRYQRDPDEHPQGIYIYTLFSSRVSETQGPLLDENGLRAKAEAFIGNVVDQYHNEQKRLRAAEISQYSAFEIKVMMFVPPNAFIEVLVTGDGELVDIRGGLKRL